MRHLEKIIGQLQSEKVSDNLKINEMLQTISRQKYDMERQDRSFRESLRKHDAECKRLEAGWMAWQQDAKRFQADVHSLNDVANAQKLMIEEQAREIDHLNRNLEAKTKKEQQFEDLLSMRNMEAEVAEKVLGVKDTMSEADVKGMVERLNSEIYNLSALITDSLSLDDGTDETDDLEANIQSTLQVQFAGACGKHVMAWTDSSERSRLLQEVYKDMYRDGKPSSSG